MEKIRDYRVVDYQHELPSGEKVWRNTDPKGQVTTDGSRMGQGDPPPTQKDIQISEWVNVGFTDEHGDTIYKWIKGPFDSEFWIDDAILQIVDEYGIVLGERR